MDQLQIENSTQFNRLTVYNEKMSVDSNYAGLIRQSGQKYYIKTVLSLSSGHSFAIWYFVCELQE